MSHSQCNGSFRRRVETLGKNFLRRFKTVALRSRLTLSRTLRSTGFLLGAAFGSVMGITDIVRRPVRPPRQHGDMCTALRARAHICFGIRLLTCTPAGFAFCSKVRTF